MDEIGQGQKMNFYPRSPRGERRPSTQRKKLVARFLSTLPARGATLWSSWWTASTGAFLSTLPARGATGKHFELAANA